MKVETFIFCHDQNFILDSIKNKKYDLIENYYFVFLGFNPSEKIEDLENVIICKNYKDNIEEDAHCLQFTGWYTILKNITLECDYLRLIDYDNDILIWNNKTYFKIKSALSFDFNFYFKIGFPDCDIFQNNVKNLTGLTVDELINKYKNNFIQNEWFSIGDVLIEKNTFKEFMLWMILIYQDIKNMKSFGHHFERYITIFCLINNIEYETKKNEIIHRQLKSHKYY